MAAHGEDSSLQKELKVIVDTSPPLTPNSPNHPNLKLSVPRAKEAQVSGSQAPTPTEEFYPFSTNPISPFYSHPQTRTSFEQLRQSISQRTSYPQAPAPAYGSHLTSPAYSSVDLELGEKLGGPPTYPRPSFDPSMAPSSLGSRNPKPCTVWPGQEHFRMKRKEMKRSRGCWPLRNLGKKQRRWVQALLVLLVIGAAVGAGIGISIRTGAGVYHGNGNQQPIS